jgi:gag-polyprotein putative aspartyl protease
MSQSIEWRHDGRRILLPCILYAPAFGMDFNGVEATALVDTGATACGITPRVARRLDLLPRGKRPLGSAQGEGQAERYMFRIGLIPDQIEGAIPSFPYIFDEVIGFELSDSFQFECLIGMDILRQCRFSMEPPNRCRLDLR